MEKRDSYRLQVAGYGYRLGQVQIQRCHFVGFKHPITNNQFGCLHLEIEH